MKHGKILNSKQLQKTNLDRNNSLNYQGVVFYLCLNQTFYEAYVKEISSNTIRKSLQTTSTSPCRTQVQAAASFLVCSLIFIEYKYNYHDTDLQ